jgi:hypothetical protein
MTVEKMMYEKGENNTTIPGGMCESETKSYFPIRTKSLTLACNIK